MFAFDQNRQPQRSTAHPSHVPRLELRARRFVFGLALSLVGAWWVGLDPTKAHAGASTAVPPNPGRGPLPTLSFNPPTLDPPTFSTPSIADIHGFTSIGFIQDATVSGDKCPDLLPRQRGGTAVVNGIRITVPCNMIVQMPAATYTWQELVEWGTQPPLTPPPATTPAAPLTLAASKAPFSFPSTEMTINGNILAGEHIAGLIFISQQSLNTGTGTIIAIDNANGALTVLSKPNGTKVRLQINDPKITDATDPANGTGRYSAGQSPDARFSVDQANPTIHAATGYPMCIPRTASGDDPRCPQKNRPLAPKCRNFADAGITLPTGREIAAPAKGQTFCSGFVMQAPFGTKQPSGIAVATSDQDPDSRQQAPLEVGDLIIWSGTLLLGDGKGPVDPATGKATDTVSVHTINANVGIFTEPGSLPVYLLVGDSRMSADAPLAFGPGIPQEPLDRLIIEAFVTDVTSIVDVYLVDINPDPANGGGQTQRWVTPQSMTSGIGANGIDGGITTQFTGLVPGRVRLQANRSVPGILKSPSRNVRVVARSLCDPANINGTVALLGAAADAKKVPCLERAPAANGLFSGQYIAPNFRFLFPENLVPGDTRVPYDFWDFGFLVLGEGPGTGPLIPKPW